MREEKKVGNSWKSERDREGEGVRERVSENLERDTVEKGSEMQEIKVEQT